MDHNDDDDIIVPPGLSEFLDQPMTRREAVRLLQPLRSALLSVFGGTMTTLGHDAMHSESEEARAKARKTFEELYGVFAEIEQFDKRMGDLLNCKKPSDESGQDPTNE